MHSVTEINRLEDLVQYQMLWNALLPKTRNASFFQSLEWFCCYWRHFGGQQRMRVMVVSACNQAVGILPLVIRRERTGVGWLKTLTYPLDDWGTCYGPIGPSPTATLLAGLGHIRDTERDWDLLDLRWVDEENTDHGRTPNTMSLAGFHPQKEAWTRATLVHTGGDWDDYWASRTKKWRHNVSRLQRRLGEQGPVEYIRYRPAGAGQGDGDPCWDLYDECVELAARSWQGSSTTGTTLSHPQVRAFLREVHQLAARKGCLDLNLLRVGGRPAAFAYNYVYDGRVFGLRMGFEPDLAPYGPGTVIQRLAIEDSFRRGDPLYDFGAGYMECKQSWRSSLLTTYHYAHYPLGVPRVQALRWKRWIRARLKPDYVANPDADRETTPEPVH